MEDPIFQKEDIQKEIDLSSLVSEVSRNFIIQRREEVAKLLQNQFSKMNGLLKDIKNGEAELNKKKENLKQVQDKINKIRSGDWDVISKIENEGKNNQPKEESKVE